MDLESLKALHMRRQYSEILDWMKEIHQAVAFTRLDSDLLANVALKLYRMQDGFNHNEKAEIQEYNQLLAKKWQIEEQMKSCLGRIADFIASMCLMTRPQSFLVMDPIDSRHIIDLIHSIYEHHNNGKLNLVTDELKLVAEKIDELAVINYVSVEDDEFSNTVFHSVSTRVKKGKLFDVFLKIENRNSVKDDINHFFHLLVKKESLTKDIPSWVWFSKRPDEHELLNEICHVHERWSTYLNDDDDHPTKEQTF